MAARFKMVQTWATDLRVPELQTRAVGGPGFPYPATDRVALPGQWVPGETQPEDQVMKRKLQLLERERC